MARTSADCGFPSDRFGTAAQACAISGLFGLERVVEEAYVFAPRAFRGTRGTAEDSGAGDGEDEFAVECGVAIEDGLPSRGLCLIEHLIKLLRERLWGC